ncbi:MAG: type II secretion system protein GspH [Planctomycetes bacterium]|nr:type II secretion system protein GspH [Planctomycetota bacterium]
MTPRPRKYAFTLLELILVMVLMAVVLAMAAPSLSNFGQARIIDDTAAHMLATIKYARLMSASEGRTYRFEVDPVRRTFGLTAQEGSAYVAIADNAARSIPLPENIDAKFMSSEAATRSHFNINPDGTVEPTTIRLTGPGGQMMEVFCKTASDEYAIRTVTDASATEQTP